VDAIIVPTARNPLVLEHAISLAAVHRCVLVTLCSKHSSAAEVVSLASGKNVEVLAIDTRDLPPGLLPKFDTCELLEGTRFGRQTDISLKRNLGLLLTQVVGWQQIVFLDDDITVPEPLDLRRAAGLAGTYAGVGLNIQGYPDNSVVCHAYREAGGEQDMFVGGGALAVHTRSMTSFFPNIYNEDWFFLLEGEKLRPTAAIGTAFQKPYDPFADDNRAREEELGDIVAEGLYWLLDEGRSLRAADAVYWRNYLIRRQRFIRETMNMVCDTERIADRRTRKLESLKAALGRSSCIPPELCAAYVRAWRADRGRWHRHVEEFQSRKKGNPHTDDMPKTMADLGLSLSSEYLPR
jgi:hypothetical protein